MKVGTRIAAGSGLLVTLLIGVLAYHVLLMQDTLKANRGAQNKFEALTLLLRQQKLTEDYDKNLRKLAAATSGRSVYVDNLRILRKEVESDLARLDHLSLDPAHRQRLANLAGPWNQLFDMANGELATDPAAEISEESAQSLADNQFPESMKMDKLVKGLSLALDEAVRLDLEETEAAGAEARRVSWGVIGLALTLCVVVTVVTVRSIQDPLGKLSGALRAVEGGQLGYRLELESEDEFSRIATSFNAMSQRLSELDQMKKEFVAHVSHELRNPLVAMQETNQLLVDELAGPLTDKQRRLLGLNIESGRRLSSMMSNLLDVSSFEAGAMTYELKPEDVVGIARFAVQEFEARARERGLRLGLAGPSSPLPVLASVDRDRLIQVLENLIENAIKLSPAGGEIELGVAALGDPTPSLPEHVAAHFAERPGVLLTVSDRGPGVPDEHKEAIFRKFHQVSRKPRTHGGGVGLGLAICREIVAAHDGAIWVADRMGGGSVFSVLLPATSATLPTGRVAIAAGAEGARA